MKDARTYERKVKKLLSGAKKTAAIPPVNAADDMLLRMIEAIFLADATDGDVAKAVSAIQKEFVDFNELRVAPEKDILECIGKEHPRGRAKVLILHAVLNGVYERANRLSVEYMADMSKREVRRHLKELGMCSFGEAYTAMTCFGVHAIPVDETLFEVLQMNQCVHESSDVDDTQAFLERIIPQKNGPAAHGYFRQYIAKHAKALEKKRKEDAARRAAEEEARRQAEEEKARKVAEAAAKKAQQEAEKEAKKAQKEAEKLAKAKAKSAPKKTAKQTAAPSAKKPAKKSVAQKATQTAKKKPVAKKPTKKKPAVKKKASKSAKKTAKTNRKRK
ncbi:MAG: hypothetical protein JXA11_03800 [Phycisphaerae bacterium]|nr:hypothetical protein [Phycisphaerae bacterium]